MFRHNNNNKLLLLCFLLAAFFWAPSARVAALPPTRDDCKQFCEERCRYVMLRKVGDERRERCSKRCKRKDNYCFSEYASMACKAQYQEESDVCYDDQELPFGNPDIVYEDVFLESGAGFEAIVSVPAPLLGKDIIAFAGDAAVGASEYGIYMARHNDDGGFVLENIVSSVTPVLELAAGDLDGDGNVDLLVSGTKPSVSWISGFGVASSESDVKVIYQDGSSHGSLIVDLDQDGIMDVVSGIRRRDVRYFPGSGGTGAQEYTIGDTSEVLSDMDICGIHDILAVDLDGDATVEIMAGGDNFPLGFLKKPEENDSDGLWNTHLVDPASDGEPGDYEPCVLQKGVDREPGTRYYCVADLDNDGILDLVTTYRWPVVSAEDAPFIEDNYSASLVWYPGEGPDADGTPRFGPKTVLAGAMPSDDGEDHGMFGVTCADFDGDGFVDIAATDRRASQVLLLKNRSQGRFGFPRVVNRQDLLGCDNLDQITHGDFDGDGKLDLAMVCKKSAQVLWMPNTAGGA